MNDRDPEHDAWLREALRHAPDAAALPPTHVSQAILAEAHAAARPAAALPQASARRRAAQPLIDAWAWLARPPVAAGFASVMAATLVGMMWWGRPMDEALPQAPTQSQAQTPSTPTPMPMPMPEPAPAPAPAPASKSRPAALSMALPPPPAATGKSPDTLPEKPPGKPPEAPPETSLSRSLPSRELERSAKRKESDPAEQRAELTPPNLAGNLASAGPAPAPAPLADAAIDKPEPPSPAAAPRPRAAVARAESKREADTFAAEPAAPLAPVIAALRDVPAAWSRRDAGVDAPIGAELQRRLAELELEAAGRWSSIEPHPLQATGDPRALLLSRDGTATVVLRLDAGVLTLDSRIDGRLRSWRAELPASAVERARAAAPWPR